MNVNNKKNILHEGIFYKKQQKLHSLIDTKHDLPTLINKMMESDLKTCIK